jgi:6-pyruvoyltetrahydropterin/6-carboxytetrahydropterin synthase
MYWITKEWEFEAAHSLPMLPVGHKCRNIHGHSYRVIVEFRARLLTEPGFVVDYALLDWIGVMFKGEFDHKNLNEVFDKNKWGATTSENLARNIYDLIRDELRKDKADYAVASVTVSETRKTSAMYREM